MWRERQDHGRPRPGKPCARPPVPYSHPGKARVPRQARGVAAAAGARVAGASTQRATRRTPWLGGSQGCGLRFPGRLGWLGAGRAPIGPSAAPPHLASVSLPGRGFQKGWGKGSLAKTACQFFRTSSSSLVWAGALTGQAHKLLSLGI